MNFSFSKNESVEPRPFAHGTVEALVSFCDMTNSKVVSN